MRSRIATACLCLLLSPLAFADEPATDSSTEILDGHSAHGEAFNEGPRQAAYLMPGLSHVYFPATTENELAQRFIHQGVAQLHGFWYYEAERSFRQAALLDPDCAICYWGMAMANVENRKRARDFIAQADQRKEHATERERKYIAAFQQFCRDEDEKGKAIEKKDRAQTYTRDLEKLVLSFPEDIEAKAFLALQLWQNERADLPIASHVAINSVLQQVFDANPMHPAHHYRIHLWDKQDAAQALQSAALCGPSLPAIAHMWHMPGHIYSKLNRYQDAVWQQEASTRVDHAHMMRDRVLPDQIHNFAHNNEWLIRNLLKIGRIDDAISLAQNMLQLPRHPKYNTLKKGSAKLGRERLLLALATYRLWPELIELSQTMYFDATDDPDLQIERSRYVGVAWALSGHADEADQELKTLEEQLAAIDDSIQRLEPNKQQTQDTETKVVSADANDANIAKVISTDEKCDDADSDKSIADLTSAAGTEPESVEDQGSSNSQPSASKVDSQKAQANQQRRKKERAAELKKYQERRKVVVKATHAVRSAQAAAGKDWTTALQLWEKSDLSDELLKAEWTAASGKTDEGLKLIDKEIKSNPREVLAQAVKAWILYKHQSSEDAREAFELTCTLACNANLDTPLLARLLPLAAELEADPHWAATYHQASDVGLRPNFDTLGPFRWHPYLAPDFVVKSTNDQDVRLKQFNDKPTLIIFYLGFGCLHCVEQLHAFSPRASEFRNAGIEIIAISSEELGSLNSALTTYSKPLEIPLHADPGLTAFKAYRCFDDFEQQPLHGAFLVDTAGRVLWQDISYDPFMDVDFVLSEAQRLLKLPR